VSNAVLHAGTSIRVAIRRLNGRIRVEVRDGDRRSPSRKHYSSMATTGRGLMLVERMSTEWGVDAEDEGKSVWFELEPHAGGVADDPYAGFAPLDIESLDDLEGFDLGGPGGFEDEPGTAGSASPRALVGAGVR
jgi:hypothetical protein